MSERLRKIEEGREMLALQPFRLGSISEDECFIGTQMTIDTQVTTGTQMIPFSGCVSLFPLSGLLS